MERTTFREGLKKSVPIMMGYIPIAIAYGVLGMKAGIPPHLVVLMSVIIYAGASQFMAISLLTTGIAPWTAILSVGVVNFRMLVMGLSFHSKVETTLPSRILLSLGLTDETFAMLSMEENLHPAFAKGVMLGSYLSWILGAVLGILFGNFLPAFLSGGLGIGLYTLFIYLLIQALDGRWKLLGIPLASIFLNIVLSVWIADGIALVLAILGGALVGIFLGGDGLE